MTPQPPSDPKAQLAWLVDRAAMTAMPTPADRVLLRHHLSSNHLTAIDPENRRITSAPAAR